MEAGPTEEGSDSFIKPQLNKRPETSFGFALRCQEYLFQSMLEMCAMLWQNPPRAYWASFFSSYSINVVRCELRECSFGCTAHLEVLYQRSLTNAEMRQWHHYSYEFWIMCSFPVLVDREVRHRSRHGGSNIMTN